MNNFNTAKKAVHREPGVPRAERREDRSEKFEAIERSLRGRP